MLNGTRTWAKKVKIITITEAVEMKSSGNVKRQNMFKLKQNGRAKHVRDPRLSQRRGEEIKFFRDLARVDGKHLSTFQPNVKS